MVTWKIDFYRCAEEGADANNIGSMVEKGHPQARARYGTGTPQIP